MLIIDTNVVSEMMRAAPSARVVDWLSHQKPSDVHMTALTIAEISYGLENLSGGRRRRDLEKRFHQVLEHGFVSRVLAFDQDAGLAYGEIMAARRAAGRPMSVIDGQIAAIARTKGAALATRNGAEFDGCDLTVVNPFAE